MKENSRKIQGIFKEYSEILGNLIKKFGNSKRML